MHTWGSRYSPYSLCRATTNFPLVIKTNHPNPYNDPLSNCWLSGLNTSYSPGGSVSFLFNGTVTGLSGESICPLHTRAFRSTKPNVLESRLYRQKFFKWIIRNNKRVTPTSTPWFLGPCILNMGQMAIYIGYWVKSYIISSQGFSLSQLILQQDFPPLYHTRCF